MKSRIIFYGLLALAAYIFLPLLAGGRQPKIPLAKTEIAKLRAALNQYRAEFGEYPSGTSAEILKILLRENSKKIQFFTVNPKWVNSAGELVDPWKTPYEIKIFQQTNFAIRSAGPNRAFGDKDDFIFNSVSNNFVKP